MPDFIPAVWKLHIPPRVHFFLWLLSKNKLLTRDDVEKRKSIDCEECLFCAEKETIQHLFFECVVARKIWSDLANVLKVNIGLNFESVASKWLCDKKNLVVNMFSSALMWSLWKLRNSLCFQNGSWQSSRALWCQIIRMARSWEILCPLKQQEAFPCVLQRIQLMASSPEGLIG